MTDVTARRKPDLPAATALSGLRTWWRGLHLSPLNIALTALSVFLIYALVPPLVKWALLSATWTFPPDVLSGMRPPRAADCAPDGACWIFVRARMGQFAFGFYPESERWRVMLSGGLGALGLYGVLGGRGGLRRHAVYLLFVVFPIVSFWLLRGGMGLVAVATDQWGGFMLTLVIALIGIVLSLPFGILLALGRRSDLPIIRTLCIAFIEFVRGVPLITVLFMANVMLPLLLPPDASVNVLLRVLVGATAFEAAYMAEAIRGGLQAIPKGQFEGAKALGLGYWQMMRLIVLPQAMRIAIPSIVNTFIGFFKDTTLVSMVSLYDFLNMVKAGFKDPNWVGVEVSGYAFCALVYWLCCFSMSRYSLHLERKLNTGYNKA